MIKYSMNYDYCVGGFIGKSGRIFKILSEKEIVSFGCKVGLLRWKASKKAVNYWYREIEVVEVKKVWNVVFPRKLTSHRASHFFFFFFFFYPFFKDVRFQLIKIIRREKKRKERGEKEVNCIRFLKKKKFHFLLFLFYYEW